jgi:hypothetical protein
MCAACTRGAINPHSGGFDALRARLQQFVTRQGGKPLGVSLSLHLYLATDRLHYCTGDVRVSEK